MRVGIPANTLTLELVREQIERGFWIKILYLRDGLKVPFFIHVSILTIGGSCYEVVANGGIVIAERCQT